MRYGGVRVGGWGWGRILEKGCGHVDSEGKDGKGGGQWALWSVMQARTADWVGGVSSLKHS
jgi:hypothetical protein